MPDPEALTQQAAHTAERYWYEDGYVNIFTGLYFLAFSLMSYAGMPSYARHDKHSRLYWIAYLIGISVGAWSRPLIKWLKERITYPRTGYAAPPDRPLPDTGFFAPPMPTRAELEYRLKREDAAKWYLVYAALLFASFAWPNRWLCIPIGIVFGVLWHRWQPSTRHRWVVPAACAVVGLAAALIPLQDNRRMGVVLFFFGGIHIFDGLHKLLAYLRRNPIANKASAEHADA
jgi:hypothetical protein